MRRGSKTFKRSGAGSARLLKIAQSGGSSAPRCDPSFLSLILLMPPSLSPFPYGLSSPSLPPSLPPGWRGSDAVAALQPPAATDAEANFAARGVIKFLMKLLTTRGGARWRQDRESIHSSRDVHLRDSARSLRAGRSALSNVCTCGNWYAQVIRYTTASINRAGKFLKAR